MYICPNCQNTSDTPINFCSKCGTPMIEKAPEAPAYAAQPAPETPAYAAPQPTPVYTAPQPVSIAYEPEKKVPLGKVIAGMAIAIAGIFFAAIASLMTLAFIGDDPEVAFGMAFAYGALFAFPLSLVGFILSKGALNDGAKSPMAKTGKILGLIGWISSAASIAISFIVMLSDM